MFNWPITFFGQSVRCEMRSRTGTSAVCALPMAAQKCRVKTRESKHTVNFLSLKSLDTPSIRIHFLDSSFTLYKLNNLG